ncbi:MAG TPA: 3-oxoacyl-ACP synthase [Deltaproteobacteria bacterium]|nr:3-oxoacyl-ACP synthase [Deltaproteobacteria bacterium]HCP47582.1 3-oxoacyl-ACP synthase [Deltaproteobacteria bacterium]
MSRHSAASKILGSAFYVPPKIVTNDDLAERIDTSDEWIRQRTGIEERRYSGPEDTPAAMAEKASRKAVEQAGIDLSEVDTILVASLSPDHTFPGTSCFLQDRLGLPGTACMDIRNQCTGLLYSLATADAFIRSGQSKYVLVVGTEVHSTGLDFSDEGRDVTVLFGDGAAAVVVGPTEDPDRGFLAHCLHADGRGAKELWTPSPGSSVFPFRAPETMFEDRSVYPQMNGRAVFKHACTHVPEVIQEVLQKTGYALDDVDLLVPHQANMRINEMIGKQLGLPPEKVVHNIQRYGNTTAASIGIALHEAREDGRIQEGSLVLMAAFGSGFTWAASLVRF